MATVPNSTSPQRFERFAPIDWIALAIFLSPVVLAFVMGGNQ